VRRGLLQHTKEDLPMENHVVVTICGEDYNFVAAESADYMQKVGSYVNGKMQEVLGGAHVGRADAAVLTAANIADELFKEQAASERLRGQIKGYVDEAARAQNEASDLKREVFRLQQKLDSRSGNAGANPGHPQGR
jgi:cell division protein ZapA